MSALLVLLARIVCLYKQAGLSKKQGVNSTRMRNERQVLILTGKMPIQDLFGGFLIQL